MKSIKEIFDNVDRWGQAKNRPIWIPANYSPKMIQEEGWMLETIQQVKEEMIELVDVILKNGKFGTCLEVGLGRYGGTSRVWLEIFEKVITVEYSHTRIEDYQSREKYNSKHKFICGPSQSNLVFDQVKDEQLDFLFIDGSHTYGAVRGDYENFARLVKPGGIIAFHDTLENKHNPLYEVWKFLQELSNGYIDNKKHTILPIVKSKIGTSYEFVNSTT